MALNQLGILPNGDQLMGGAMSLKTISIGALARALAATSLIGAAVVPTIAAAQAQTPAEQAAALANVIAQAVQNAVANGQNVEAAIAASIDGVDPAIAEAALTQAQAIVLASTPPAAQASVLAAFTSQRG